jgi:hypothetical protein
MSLVTTHVNAQDMGGARLANAAAVHAVHPLTAAAIEASRYKRARTHRSASGRRSEVACMGGVR